MLRGLVFDYGKFTKNIFSKTNALKRVKNVTNHFHITRIVSSTHIACRAPLTRKHLNCITAGSVYSCRQYLQTFCKLAL